MSDPLNVHLKKPHAPATACRNRRLRFHVFENAMLGAVSGSSLQGSRTIRLDSVFFGTQAGQNGITMRLLAYCIIANHFHLLLCLSRRTGRSVDYMQWLT